jgi:hypothetical protein
MAIYFSNGDISILDKVDFVLLIKFMPYIGKKVKRIFRFQFYKTEILCNSVRPSEFVKQFAQNVAQLIL